MQRQLSSKGTIAEELEAFVRSLQFEVSHTTDAVKQHQIALAQLSGRSVSNSSLLEKLEQLEAAVAALDDRLSDSDRTLRARIQDAHREVQQLKASLERSGPTTRTASAEDD